MKFKSCSFIALIVQVVLSLGAGAVATRPSKALVGEQVPSEDPILKNFHSLGLIQGRVDIFRSASPVRDLGVAAATTRASDKQMQIADERIEHLRELGIRTIVCLEDPKDTEAGNDAAGRAKVEQLDRRLKLEQAAARDEGVRFVMMPMDNAGPNSLEYMSDVQVLNLLQRVSEAILEDSRRGGVVFHCSAGHDRTGIVAAFIRIKYQGWPVQQAIDEMRRYGHNWPKFSENGGISSWHEDHLRAIAKIINAEDTTGIAK